MICYINEKIYITGFQKKKTNELLKNGCIVNFMTCLFSHKSLWIKLNGIVYLPPAEKYLFLGNAKK